MSRTNNYSDSLSLHTIYAAEDTAFRAISKGGTVEVSGARLDLSRCRIQTFTPAQLPLMRGITAGLWAQHHDGTLPAPSIQMRPRAYKKASYSSAEHTIYLPGAEWGWTMPILLHELGHALTRTGHNQRSAHGAEWRQAFSRLVAHAIGPEAGRLLADALDVVD